MPIPIILGKCPSVINSVIMTIVNYNISRNGATTALVMCSSDQQTYIAECGIGGLWSTDAAEVCLYGKFKINYN